MNNCTIDGTLYVYGDMDFNDCKFVKEETEGANAYNMHIYYGDVNFYRCEFDNSGDKARRNVNIYHGNAQNASGNYVADQRRATINFNSTTFKTSSINPEHKSAIVVHEAKA